MFGKVAPKIQDDTPNFWEDFYLYMYVHGSAKPAFVRGVTPITFLPAMLKTIGLYFQLTVHLGSLESTQEATTITLRNCYASFSTSKFLHA